MKKRSLLITLACLMILPSLSGCSFMNLPNGSNGKNASVSKNNSQNGSRGDGSTTETIGDYTIKYYESTSASIVAYNGSATDVTIPTKIDGKTITEISENSFDSSNKIESLTIPVGISANSGSLSNLSNLRTLSIPNVTSFAGYLFGKIQYRNTYQVKRSANDDSFYIPNNFEELIITGGKVGEASFSYFTSLKKVTFEKVSDMKSSCFAECSNLEEVEFKETNNHVISYKAFSNCKKLNKVTFGSGLSYIFGYAFENTGLTELVLDTENTDPLRIDIGAFLNCNIIKLTLGNVDFQKDATVGYNTFAGCQFVAELHLTEKAKNIYEEVFMSFRVLEKITVDPNNPYFDSRNNCNAIISRQGSRFSENQLVCGCKNTVIPNDVTGICKYAFYNRIDMPTKITLPESVTAIGAYSFAYTGITNIDLSRVTSIGVGALTGCYPKELYIRSLPGGLLAKIFDDEGKPTSVPSSLSTITLDMSEIPANACKECSGIKTVYIRGGCTSIGDSAFEKCGVSTIYFPTTLRKLGKSSFLSSKIDVINTANTDTLLQTFGIDMLTDANLLNGIITYQITVNYGVDY